MQLDIPGYYYDSAKRKYFRIEHDRTAPPDAAWSSRNVRRRAADEQEDAAKEEKLRRQARLVRRAPLWRAPLLGGMLAREAGIRRPSSSSTAETQAQAEEAPLRAWAAGLRRKGDWRVFPELDDGLERMVSALWVGTTDDERGEVAVAFAAGACTPLCFSHLPVDRNDRITPEHVGHWWPGFIDRDPIPWVKFHKPSRRLLVGWNSSFLGAHPINGHGLLCSIHSCQPAPTSSSRLLCALGTEKGVACVRDGRMSLLDSTPPPRLESGAHGRKRGRGHERGRDARPWQSDVLAVDFLAENPAEVVLAGTRSSYVCMLDLREPPASWTAGASAFRHASSVAHVRSVGGHGVLAAGPRSKMCLYDVRFLAAGRNGGNRAANAAKPVVEFPAYRNDARVRIGLDVLTEGGYGSGLVAAAHDDGTVGVYSLRDGTRVAAGEVDGIRAPAPVESLLWSALPGDRHPSLFVGESLRVVKYSFSRGEEGEEAGGTDAD